ncbi:MAG: S26 family signal peptidase [Leptospirales bacterium]
MAERARRLLWFSPPGQVDRRKLTGRYKVLRGGSMLVAVVGFLFAAPHYVIVNTSRSMPLGLYAFEDGALSRGSIGAVCLHGSVANLAFRRGYEIRHTSWCPSGLPLIKTIGGTPGDTIRLSRQITWINGVRQPRSGILSSDTAGRPLPHPAWGTYQVKSGEVWFFSFRHQRSLDSRYFGAVSIGDVRRVVPVLVF